MGYVKVRVKVRLYKQIQNEWKSMCVCMRACAYIKGNSPPDLWGHKANSTTLVRRV